MDSILISVKKLLGIPAEHIQFDPDLIMDINATFNVLTQLGVGPEEGFSISDDSAVWTDFVDDQRLNMVRTYVGLKVRMMFDPPTSGIVLESVKSLVSELEWRLNVEVDPGEEEES